MFFILFQRSKEKSGNDYRAFQSEQEVINFIHRNYEIIEVERILETDKSYHLGLIETGEFIKSTLEPEKETLAARLRREHEGNVEKNKEALEPEEVPAELDHPDPLGDAIKKAEREKKATKELEDLILAKADKAIVAPGDMTDEEILQKNKEALEKADKAIADAKKTFSRDKTGWELCTKCGTNKVSPWNKKGICSPCQRPKGTRKYTKRKTKAETKVELEKGGKLPF